MELVGIRYIDILRTYMPSSVMRKVTVTTLVFENLNFE